MIRDWSRHTNPPVLCPFMLRALAEVSELGVAVDVTPGRILAFTVPPSCLNADIVSFWERAKAELLRHEKEAIELLERWSQVERPEGPAGVQ